MNQPRTLALALSLAATVTGSARADGFFGGLFGLGGAGTPAPTLDPSAAPMAVGLPPLELADLPVFGGFRAGPAAVAAHPGMVLRTQAHAAARARASEGVLRGHGLQVSRPLGDYSSEADRSLLMGVVLSDSVRLLQPQGFSFGSPWFAEDTRDVLRRRLEAVGASLTPGAGGASERSLAVTLRSVGGTRQRHLLVIRAELSTMDAERYWLCQFYDPHMAEGAANRVGTFRISADPDAGLGLEFSSAWLAEAGGSDPFADFVDVDYAFAPVASHRLEAVEDTTASWDLEAYTEGYRAQGLSEAQAAGRLVEARTQPQGLSNWNRVAVETADWVGGDLEWGAFDGTVRP